MFLSGFPFPADFGFHLPESKAFFSSPALSEVTTPLFSRASWLGPLPPLGLEVPPQLPFPPRFFALFAGSASTFC